MDNLSNLKKAENLKGKAIEIIGINGLLELAKNGKCPHYILTNPLTNETSIWFATAEINDWFNHNYVHRVESNYGANHRFILFEETEFKPRKEDVIPRELLAISELYKLPLHILNTPPGIYFLCLDGKIKYIGQAVNVAYRISSHLKENVKSFDTVYFIKCPINKLDETEGSLIRHFRPEYNISAKGVLRGNDKILVSQLCKEN